MAQTNMQAYFDNLMDRLSRNDPTLTVIDFSKGLSEEQINSLLILMCNKVAENRFFAKTIVMSNVVLNGSVAVLLAAILEGATSVTELILNQWQPDEPVENIANPRPIGLVARIIAKPGNLETLRVCLCSDGNSLSELYPFRPLVEALEGTKINKLDFRCTPEIDQRQVEWFGFRLFRKENRRVSEYRGSESPTLSTFASAPRPASTGSLNPSRALPLTALARAASAPGSSSAAARATSSSPDGVEPLSSQTAPIQEFVNIYWQKYNEYVDAMGQPAKTATSSDIARLNPIMIRLVYDAFRRQNYHFDKEKVNKKILAKFRGMSFDEDDAKFMGLNPAKIGADVPINLRLDFYLASKFKFNDVLPRAVPRVSKKPKN